MYLEDKCLSILKLLKLLNLLEEGDILYTCMYVCIMYNK